MSDRAKARLLAAGISVLLSVQVVLILLGALALFNRIRVGGPNGGIGSIFLAQPAAGTILGGTGGLAGPPGGGLTPGTPPTGPVPPPPTGPCADCGAAQQPLAGLTLEGDLPVVGSFELPARLGSSSGDNFSRSIRVGDRLGASITLSRHPVRDVVDRRDTGQVLAPTSASGEVRRHELARRRHERALIRALGRLVRSLLRD